MANQGDILKVYMYLLPGGPQTNMDILVMGEKLPLDLKEDTSNNLKVATVLKHGTVVNNFLPCHLWEAFRQRLK